VPSVIAIQEGDVLPLGLAYPLIAGGAMPAMFALNNAEARIAARMAFRDLSGVVIGAIVNDQVLKVPEALTRYRFNGFAYISSHVVSGGNDGDKRMSTGHYLAVIPLSLANP
jgi:hypothetical protein